MACSTLAESVGGTRWVEHGGWNMVGGTWWVEPAAAAGGRPPLLALLMTSFVLELNSASDGSERLRGTGHRVRAVRLERGWGGRGVARSKGSNDRTASCQRWPLDEPP